MPHYGLQQTVAPALEPVSLAEAKLWLRLDPDLTADDAVVQALVAAARERAENVTGLQLAPATWVLTRDWFPGYAAPGMSVYPYGDFYAADRGWDEKRTLRLPRPPLLGVVSLQYVDTTGTPQTLAATGYTVDAQSRVPRVAPAYGTIWPVTRAIQNAVTLTYQSGWAHTTVALDTPAGVQTVTPASMLGITAGMTLRADVGTNQEVVTVGAVTATTFTATFLLPHVGPWVVSAVPEGIRLAIRYWVAARYEHRGDDAGDAGVEATFDRLLLPWWTGGYDDA